MTRALASLRMAAAMTTLSLLPVPGSVSGQNAAGAGFEFLGYDFDAGLGAEAAQLLMIPVALRVPVREDVTVDVSSAWAEGRIEVQGTRWKLSGPVDTGVRAAYQALPWVLVTLGANVPTGTATHDSGEAIVASVLSTDLLGFREATWGRGFALTSSVAVARSFGSFGLGLAAAYAHRGRFNPSTEQADLQYEPGNEARIRVGLDRNFGNSTLTAGATFIDYAQDRVASDAEPGGRNLFQAGRRIRLDATYAFRMGAGVWTVYAADLIRRNGNLSLPNLDSQNLPLGTFTDVQTPRQNLLIAGVMGTVAIGGGFVLRPHADFKLQSREDPTGSNAGSGWLVAFGGDVPLRIFGGYDFFPKARALLGSIKDPTGAGVAVFGMELRGTVRLAF